ncbi:MAG: heavy metal translocating P-type ATPase [Alphaproteobacteria bacterium]|nr:heavy metal translocating P-type ATPase [Alphaproteobacteria bacterium]
MPQRRLVLAFVALAMLAGGAGWWAGWAGVAAAVFSIAALPIAYTVGRDTLRTLIGGSLGVDIVALVAILAALALGEHFTAALIALMVAGGGALEEFAEARARRELMALVSRIPRIAHRRVGDGLEDVAVAEIAQGDRLLVKPGEVLPVDGVIEEAAASLDEAALTGEPMPVSRAIGDIGRSGTVNAGGPIALRATASADRSTYAAVVRLVEAAEGERPPMARLADRWALWFLPATLATAGAAWLMGGGPERALAVLVVATPCPLILAAPVALICGISRAARHGVIVKGGGALERLARVRTALFDKTGTLTTGTPRLSAVEPLGDFTVDEVLRLAASLEQVSVHVVAAAIVSAARAADLPLSLPGSVHEIPGGGLSGVIDGRAVTVGSAALLAAAGFVLPTGGAAARLAAAAASASWVAIDGRVAGALLLADRIRPETPRAIRDLRAAGVGRLVMVTGDRAAAAEAVGEALGLDAVHAELTPEGKIAAVRAERPCLMIGDGINDAPALAAADVGVAMGARGAAAAAEAADVVLLVDRIDRIAAAIVTARRARAIALQSIAVGMGLSGIAMAAAAFGYLPPVWGALLQEAIDVAVILNALRALGGGAAPAVLPAAAGVPQVLAEHGQLRALMERMRRTADGIHADDGLRVHADALREVASALDTLLLPHQREEERHTFPELARRLGGRDPLGAMTRMHEEISHLAARFSALTAGLDDGAGSAAEARELRRLLYVLDAVIALHLAAEEELLAQAEEAGHR